MEAKSPLHQRREQRMKRFLECARQCECKEIRLVCAVVAANPAMRSAIQPALEMIDLLFKVCDEIILRPQRLELLLLNLADALLLRVEVIGEIADLELVRVRNEFPRVLLVGDFLLEGCQRSLLLRELREQNVSLLRGVGDRAFRLCLGCK